MLDIVIYQNLSRYGGYLKHPKRAGKKNLVPLSLREGFKKKKKKLGEFSPSPLPPPPPVSGKKMKKPKMIYAS